MAKLTDESKMPYGNHEGTRMIDVPASYLIWLHENNRCSKDVQEYVDDNIDILTKEASK